jgi:hypothetical protein
MPVVPPQRAAQVANQGGDVPVNQFLPQMVADLNAAVNQKKGKNPDKIKCNRCGLAGHIAYGCVQVLCDFCERAGHANADCPLHNAPKPQMIMHGIADDELCFFEMPCTASYKPKMENSRTGRISIDGGVLTAQQIVSQLQRLVPVENYHWDVFPTEDNSFRATFPNKAELERLKVFGACNVPNTGCTMTVDSWGARVDPNVRLPEVWIRVAGIPPRHRGDYLAVWALGTLFGKTFEVDTPFTRQHGIARIRIGCMDFTKIPALKSVFIKDGFFDLLFEVENAAMLHSDAVMHDAYSHDDDTNGGNGNLGGLGEVRGNGII